MSQTNIISVGNINTEPGSGYVAVFVQSFVPPESTVSRVARDTDAPIVTHPADQTVRQRIGKPAPKKKKPFKMKSLSFFLAETEGFEPSMRVLARMLP